MKNDICTHCGGDEFTEGKDYMPIKQSKASFIGSYKIYRYCSNCGEVASIRIEKPTFLKNK